MTLYIAQFTMPGRTQIWTANDDQHAIMLCAERYESLDDCNDLNEAVQFDQMDAYVTDDPLDLFAWINTHRQSIHADAWTAFFKALGHEIEQMAQQRESADETFEYVAFDGDFIWREDDEEWTLGNYPPEKADGLPQAICAAYMLRWEATSMESRDV